MDPDNRLLAGELERRREEKLQQLQCVQDEYATFQRTATSPTLTPELRHQLQQISETLPELWQSSRLTYVQKKTLLRSLIARVILKRSAPDCIEVKIVWVSRHFTIRTVRQPVWRAYTVTGYTEMVKRIEELWQQGQSDEAIAAQLTQEGFHSARAESVTVESVFRIRLAHRWFRPLHPSRGALELQGCLTATGLTRLIEVDRSWVYRKLEHGGIEPRYFRREPDSGVYLIVNDAELIERLRQAVHRRLRAKKGI